MSEKRPGLNTPTTRRLSRLDLAAHGTAIVSCTVGGFFLESVVLIAAASHHLATLGIRLLTTAETSKEARAPFGGARASITQVAIWTGCLGLGLYVTSSGAHSVFHAKQLNTIAVLGFALPGAVGVLSGAALIRCSTRPGSSTNKTDVLLSAAPSLLVLCVAAGALLVDGGRLDGILGLAMVPMLGIRILICLPRVLN